LEPQSTHSHSKYTGNLLINQFNSLTSENHMKFEALQPEKGVFNFTVADELTAFAKNITNWCAAILWSGITKTQRGCSKTTMVTV